MKQLSSFFLVLFAFLMPIQLTAQCFPGWTNYLPFTSTNSTAGPLLNFQVKVTVNTLVFISGGNMNSAGNDIRFSNQVCGNLPYFIESGINTANTVIWIKVDSIPASGSTTFNMYYGNPTAPALSNADSVFDFHDDFNDNIFDLTKWETRGTFLSLVESGGVVTGVGNGNWEYFRSRVNFTGPIVIEDRFQAGTSAGFTLGVTATDNRYTLRENGGICGTTYDPDVSTSNTYFDAAYPGVPFPLAGMNDFRAVVKINANYIEMSSYCNLTTSNCNNVPRSLNTYTAPQFNIGYSAWGNGSNIVVDWVRVRKYVSAEPVTVAGTPQGNFVLRPISLNDSTLCPGQAFTMDFDVVGTFVPGNIYTGQLSDALGSFAVPSAVGTLAGSSPGTFTMSCMIPANAAPGTTYLLRLTATNPALTGQNSSFFVTVHQPPMVNLGPDTSVCGGSIVLDAGNQGSNFLWSDNSMAQTLTPTLTNNYWVLVTDRNGCTGSDTVHLNMSAAPVVALGPDFSACPGTILLDAGNPGSTYLWSSGPTTQTISPGTAGTYSVVVTNGGGCVATDTVTVSLYPVPSPVLSVLGNTLDAGGPFSSYTWYLNNVLILGANSQTYTASQSGWYRVEVTNSNGCVGIDSLSVNVVTGREIDLNSSFKIWPNPVNDYVNIQFPSTSGFDIHVTVSDANGKTVQKRNLLANGNSETMRLDISNLSKGIYHISVTTPEGVAPFRFVRE